MAEQTSNNGMIPWKKPRGPAPKYTEAQVRVAIEEARGNISLAARNLGCSPPTVYSYIEESEELQRAVMLAREVRKDEYESALDKRRDQGSDAAIIFFLKTQAKDRGYIERAELDANFNINVNVDDDFNPPISEDAEFDIGDTLDSPNSESEMNDESGGGDEPTDSNE